MDREELLEALYDIVERADEDDSYTLDDIVFDLNELIKDLWSKGGD